MIKQIPNILTITRILFIPFIVLSIVKNEYVLAFILFTISAITDILDGIIARRFKLESNFGKFMDPVADKLTQVSILLTLSLKRVIPIWIFAFVICKEILMMIGGAFLYKKRDVVVYSKWYGKLTTVLIYLAVVSSFIIKVFPSLGAKFKFFGYDVTFDIVIYILALILALYSFLSYAQFFGKDIIKKKNDSNIVEKDTNEKDEKVEISSK